MSLQGEHLTETSSDGNQPTPHQSTTMRRQLRAMQLGDILDTTFGLYRSYFWLFVGITAVLHVPFGVVEALVLQSASDAADFLALGLALIKGLLVAPLVAGALVFAIAQEYLGSQTTVGEAFRGAKLGAILVTSLIMTVLLMICALIAPLAFYFWVCWSFLAQCIVVEGLFGMNALRRSRELVRGSWWRVCGILLVLWAIVTVVVPGFTYGLGGLLDSLLGTDMLMLKVTETLANVLVTPLSLIGATLLYFDLRIRKEAFDLELMAKQIHGA